MLMLIFLLGISVLLYPIQLFSMRTRPMNPTADSAPVRSHSRNIQTPTTPPNTQNEQPRNNENHHSGEQADQEEIIQV